MRRALLSRNRFFLRKETSRQGSGKDEKRKEALGGESGREGLGKACVGEKEGGKKGRYVWEGAKGKGEVRLPPPPSFFHFSRVKHEIVYRRFDLPRQ